MFPAPCKIFAAFTVKLIPERLQCTHSKVTVAVIQCQMENKLDCLGQKQFGIESVVTYRYVLSMEIHQFMTPGEEQSVDQTFVAIDYD